MWIFGGIPVAQAVPHVGVGFGVMRTVLGVDESDSFELSFGIEVLAAVGQVVLGIAPQRENGRSMCPCSGESGRRVSWASPR